MIRLRIFTIVAASALALLGGCQWLGSGAEPDALARWAADKGVSVAGAFGDIKDAVVRPTDDGHGYVLIPKEKGSAAPTRLYLVPLASIDEDLESRLRRAIFPSGVAALSPKQDSEKPRHLAETEVESFYVQAFVSDKAALCDDFTTPCAAASTISLVGKIRGAPLMGKRAKVLDLDPVVLGSAKLTDGKLADPQKTCGFDPQRDRIPRHIATSCDRIRLMAWAGSNGFTVTKAGSLLPVSPSGLEALLTAVADGPMYEGKLLRGHLLEEE
jgi:hypothetical protein